MTCHHGLAIGTCAVCKYGPTVSAPYMGPPNEPDYTYEARKHDTVSKRSRKGRTTLEVKRYGRAMVTGALDLDANGNPLLGTLGDVHVLHPSSAAARLLVRAMERGEIGRNRVGLSELDIERIAREAYGDLLPPIAGSTNVRQYEQVIHKDRGASTDVATHTTDIGGGFALDGRPFKLVTLTHADGSHSVSAWSDDPITDIAAQTDACGPQTKTQLPWQTRGTYGVTKFGRLPYEPRETDPKARRVFRVASDGTCERVSLPVVIGPDTIGLPSSEQTTIATVAPRMDVRYTRHGTRLVGTSGIDRFGKSYGRIPVYCPGVASVTRMDGSPVFDTIHHAPETASVERLFIGHDSIARQPAGYTIKLKDERTTLTADVLPEGRDAWATLIAALEPGKRADLTAVTITRGKQTQRGTMYRATDRRGDEVAYLKAWTAEGLAAKLA